MPKLTRRGVHVECVALYLTDYSHLTCINCLDAMYQVDKVGKGIALREMRLDPSADVHDETPQVDWLFEDDDD